MRLQTRVVDYKLVVSLEGDLLGGQNGVELLNVIETEISKGNHDIIIDFSKVRYINSTGLGVLITILSKVKKEEGSLKVVEVSEQVVRLFEITQLDKVFEIKSKK